LHQQRYVRRRRDPACRNNLPSVPWEERGKKEHEREKGEGERETVPAAKLTTGSRPSSAVFFTSSYGACHRVTPSLSPLIYTLFRK
jgi:hypothetical protein